MMMAVEEQVLTENHVSPVIQIARHAMQNQINTTSASAPTCTYTTQEAECNYFGTW